MIAGTTTLLMILGSSSSARAECGEGRVWLALLSGLGILGVGVYDIATAPASAQRYNEQHWSVAPVMDARDHRYGLAMAYTFGQSSPSTSFRQQEWYPMTTSSSKSGPRPSPAMAPSWLRGEAHMPPDASSMADTSIQHTRRSFKSPQTALAASLIFTLAPVAMGGAVMRTGTDPGGVGVTFFSAGWTFGPSAGHWYAGQTARGWKTAGLRLGLAGVGTVALISAVFSCTQ